MRRPDEQAAIGLVYDALQKEGRKAVEDVSFDDNPDCVFEIGDSRIAADCTNLNLEAFMKWSNSRKRFEHEKQYEIKFALEPHYWLRNSIDEKREKIEKYREEACSDEVWLIVHALEDPTNFDCNETTIAIMTDAARYLQPSFDEIWFVHKEFPATRLWRMGDPAIENFPRWDTSEGQYPFENIIQGHSTITSSGLNKTITFGASHEEIFLEPLDPTWNK